MQFCQNLIWKSVALRPRFSSNPRGSVGPTCAQVCLVWVGVASGHWHGDIVDSIRTTVAEVMSGELSVRSLGSILWVLL